jgi:hypothetical protein
VRTWILLASILLQFGLGYGQKNTLTPVNLTTEMRSDPISIETTKPGFGWNLEATSMGARNLRQRVDTGF